jgi:hypothetical protein
MWGRYIYFDAGCLKMKLSRRALIQKFGVQKL